MKKLLVGFIGQGYVGQNLADNFEKRGFRTVRYSLEPEYAGNKSNIKECDIVFIAVPTPTTQRGFDGSLLEKVLPLVGRGKIAVVKSTIIPGLTKKLQRKFPSLTLLHSPEFLSEATAVRDTNYPFSSIVGMSRKTAKHRKAAETAIKILPQAPFSAICMSDESEIIKYSHNCGGFVQIIFFNLVYELARKHLADWKVIQRAIEADPFIPNRYANPLHKGGRGAGGNCFIKDFAAFLEAYKKALPFDQSGIKVLQAAEKKNIELLKKTKKDLNILRKVYGKI